MTPKGFPIGVIEKFDLIDQYWSPRIVSQVNDMHILLAKIKGEFV